MNPQAPAPSAWRFFPMWVIGALFVVVAVNAAMITAAVQGFPGRTGRNGFDLSNQYDKVLAEAEREAALGWKIDTALRDGRPVLSLRDKAGEMLPPTRITMEARRPVGPARSHVVELRQTGVGTYVATMPLDSKGQWDLLLTIEARGETMRATRRLYIP